MAAVGNSQNSNRNRNRIGDDIRKSNVARTTNTAIDSKLPELTLESISYCVMSSKRMNAISVMEVRNKKNTDMLENTVDDLRLGTIETHKQCATCNKTNDECPGHYGIIKLENNMFHPLFRDTTIKILQSICWKCLRPLLGVSELSSIVLKGIQRLSYIAKKSKGIKHTNCESINDYNSSQNPEFKTGTNQNRNCAGQTVSASNRDNICINATILDLTGEVARKRAFNIHPSKVEEMFNKLSDETVRLLGFEGYYKNGEWIWRNHPRNFIIDFIPVIPLSARPFRIREGDKRDDFITKFYEDVLNYKSGGEHGLSMVLWCYNHIIDNSDKAYKKTSVEVIKSFKERLVGKQELIRGSLMGKRSDFTARTVLGPNCNIEFGEIAPPEAMRSVLTVPESVTVYNIKHINKLAESGEILNLIQKNGTLAGRKLRFNISKHTIELGDIVERFSRDGDVIVFNRQPTLQKQSMCAYKCRFQKKLSVGIHITSTTGHNADFDGDEGNIHMLQSAQAQSEARSFVSAQNCIMSGINSAPVGGVIFNGATGGYLLSNVTELTETEYLNGVNSTRYTVEHINTLSDRMRDHKCSDKYTGKRLCSILFPPDFWYKQGKVVISKGVLLNGQLSKSNMGSSPNSIIQSLYKQYGIEVTRRFITDATFLFNWYLGVVGFTVGIKDCIPNDRDFFISEKNKIIDTINERVKADTIEFDTTYRNATEFERSQHEEKIDEIITLNTDKIKTLLTSLLSPNNAIKTMADSGAKGKLNDTTKIMGLLGQQYVPNKRPSKLISRGKRWLSSFSVDDNSIESRGFIKHSFFEGLDPDEFFAHSMASRIGLCNTAVKTAEIGALQRRMVKSMEDLITEYDGSVRNQNGSIFQLSYGAGFGASKLIRMRSKAGHDYLSFINLEETVGKINIENGVQNENYIFDTLHEFFNNQ